MAILGLPRSSLYSHPNTLAIRNERDKQALLEVHSKHRHYGVARLAVELHWSEAKTRRIRDLAGITIHRRNKKHYTKHLTPDIKAPDNALQQYAKPCDGLHPQNGMNYQAMTKADAWVQDFTYFWVDSHWHYLAVVLNLKTRVVLSWKLGLSHTSELTYLTLLEALSNYPSPKILHSDQGSEYLSFKHQTICHDFNITLSCSTKGSPWQNGFMERFFCTLKDELPPINQIKSTIELYEAIALTIYYYNNQRIHSALNYMTPIAYANKLQLESQNKDTSTIDNVSKKVRG